MDGFESPPSSAGTANGATLATPHSTLDKVDRSGRAGIYTGQTVMEIPYEA